MLRILIIFTLVISSSLSLAVSRAHGLTLTEDKVIDMALQQNLGIQISKLDREVGATTVMAAKSQYDTLLELQGDYLVDKLDNPIPVFGTDNRTTNFNIGLSKLIPSGTRARLEWLNRHESTNSAFATINPFFESTVALSIEQPLLRNYFGYQDRGTVNVAKKEYEASDAQAQRQIREQVFGVAVDYWRWVTDQAIVKVTKQALDEAQRFEKAAEQKEEFGLYESTDVLTAEANRLNFESQLVLSRLNQENSREQLKTDLDLEGGVEISSQQSIRLSNQEVGLVSALTRALAQRTDYQAAKASLQGRKIQVALAENSRWPQLDLVASLSLNGVNPDYGDSLGEIGGADHPAYFIGGEFSFPIENRLARSNTERARLEKASALYRLKGIENDIRQDVSEQWRSVRDLGRIVKIRKNVTKVEREKLIEEFKKYQTGRSDSDIVTRFQQDYFVAQRLELEAYYNYQVAVLGLRLAQNTLIP